MLVDVMFERQQSAYVCVEVPDDATEEQIEAAAMARVQESDWSRADMWIDKIVCEPSLWSGRLFFLGGHMKRVRAQVEIARRTYVEFEVDDDADTEDIKETALDEAELAEWDDDPPEVVSIEIIEPA
jgi:hypothetical protein